MQKKSKKFKVIMLIISIVLSICTITGSVVLAKYLYSKSSDGSVIAKKFYFTSDLLDGQEHIFTPGTESITFTIGNHADELRYSEVSISFSVIVKKETPIVEGEMPITITNETGIFEIDIENNKTIQNQMVSINNLTAGTYTVTAIGKQVPKGYTKTLTATIVILEPVKELYHYLDKSVSEYIVLKVWNEGTKTGEVTINYTGIPDNTNPNMSDWLIGDESNPVIKKILLNPQECKEYRFFSGIVNVEGTQLKELH